MPPSPGAGPGKGGPTFPPLTRPGRRPARVHERPGPGRMPVGRPRRLAGQLGSYPKAIGLGREFSAGLLAADLEGKKLAQDLEHLRIAVAFQERRPRLG